MQRERIRQREQENKQKARNGENIMKEVERVEGKTDWRMNEEGTHSWGCFAGARQLQKLVH
jgi:ribosomal protein RSM22 (predicted rRNA methylase)